MRKIIVLVCFLSMLATPLTAIAGWKKIEVDKDQCYMAEYADLYVKEGTTDEFKTVGHRGEILFWKVHDSDGFLMQGIPGEQGVLYQCDAEGNRIICDRTSNGMNLYWECTDKHSKSMCRAFRKEYSRNQLCLITTVAAEYKQTGYAKNYEPSWESAKAKTPEPAPQAETIREKSLPKVKKKYASEGITNQLYNGCYLIIENVTPDDIEVRVNYVSKGHIKARHTGYIEVSCNAVSVDIYPEGINYQRTMHKAFGPHNIRRYDNGHHRFKGFYMKYE